MDISCVACQNSFPLPADRMHRNGSMVRCLECGYIFMVYPPQYYGSPVTQDTNIDQSILDDLLEMQAEQAAPVPAIEFSEEEANKMGGKLRSIGDPGKENTDSGPDDAEYAELPDLSELENMIDWDDINDPDDPTAKSNPNGNDTQELDINIL